MSARATSLRRISRPSSVFRFSVTLRTPRLLVSKYVLGRPGSTVEPRDVSPPSGTSILITSAPRSAISMYGTVPAWAVEHATTLTPCSGPWGAAMSNDLLRFDLLTECYQRARVIRHRRENDHGIHRPARAHQDT